MSVHYTADYWRPIIERLIAAEFPRVDVPFAEKWGEIESGWNPAAIGTPGQLYAGYPAEIGIGQLYNPDDFAAFGANPADFRAYCVGDSQVLARALTEAEAEAQIRITLLKKIAQGMTHADGIVTTFGLTWSPPDYYKLVKAPHALPGILGQGMPAVVKKLGRAPSTWSEFRAVLGMDHNDMWKRALDACETCGNAVATES